MLLFSCYQPRFMQYHHTVCGSLLQWRQPRLICRHARLKMGDALHTRACSAMARKPAGQKAFSMTLLPSFPIAPELGDEIIQISSTRPALPASGPVGSVLPVSPLACSATPLPQQPCCCVFVVHHDVARPRCRVSCTDCTKQVPRPTLLVKRCVPPASARSIRHGATPSAT